MEFNTDAILLFLGGMIIGGFIYVRVEPVVLARIYPDDSTGDERLLRLKKVGFVLTFAGVFALVLVFFLVKSMFLSGICAGFAVFGIKP